MPHGESLISFKNKKIHFGLHVRTHSWAPECKLDDDAERQLLYTPLLTAPHAIVFIVSICCLQNSGGGIYSPLSSRTARLTKARLAQVVIEWEKQQRQNFVINFGEEMRMDMSHAGST